MKLRLRSHTRRTAEQVVAINAYPFPSSVRQRFHRTHPDLGNDSTELIEAATRQWFRILARHPKTRLSMPSPIVDELWHELLLHTRDYTSFCNAAFGRYLHHEPESAMSPDHAAASHSQHLLTTLRLAHRDENCWPELPLLFRVDHAVAGTGARRYIADCGGRGYCSATTLDLVCLHHLAGLEDLDPNQYRGNPTLRALHFGGDHRDGSHLRGCCGEASCTGRFHPP
jgi:hypothetical protein